MGRRFTLLAGCRLALLVPLLVTAAVSADAVSDFEANRLGQQQATKSQIAAMPDLDKSRIDEVLRIRMESGNLLIRTLLPSTEGHGYARASVAEVDQPLLIRIEGGASPGTSEPIVPGELLFQLNDYSQPLITIDLSISQSSDAALTIVEGYSTPAIQRSVQLMWQKAPLMPGGGMAQLIVKETGVAGANLPAVRLDLSEPDCAALARRHPQAVEKYLRPILDRLAQEGAFAADAMLALQVFPQNLHADPKLRQQIERILPDLGDADFHRRDRATAELQEMGVRAAMAMIGMDRSHLSPEQNTRLDRVVAPLGLILRADAERLAQDRDFLLTCLYCDDPATRRSATAQLKRVTGQAIDFDADGSLAVRSAAVRELRKKLRPEPKPQ